MKHRKISIILILLFVFVISMFSLNNVTAFEKVGDTEVYRTSIETWGGWREWAEAYYHGNSGRVLIHAILIVLVNQPIILYKLLVAGMITLTCFMFYLFSNSEAHCDFCWKPLLILGAALICYFTIPSSVLGSSVRWAPGALNYLFPVAALLVCLYPYYLILHQKKIPLVSKIASAGLICLCANMEQASAVYLAMGIIVWLNCLIMKRKAAKKSDAVFAILLWCINLIVFLVSYLAPGNEIRYREELLRFVGYEMYTLADKLILGFQLVWLYFSSVFGFMIWLLPSFLLGMKCLLRKDQRGLILPCIHIVLSVIQNYLVRRVFDMECIQPMDISYILWLGFAVAMIFLNGAVILSAMGSCEDKFWYLFLYYGAIVAGVVVAVSPTLYVSAARTMYITFVLYCLIIVRIVGEMLPIHENCQVEKEYPHSFNTFIGIVSVCLVTSLFLLSSFQTKKVDASYMNSNPDYQVENVYYHAESRKVTASIDVSPFKYTADNWCQGPIDGFDIYVQLGILDTADNNIRTYKTCVNTVYPVMSEFTENRVDIVGYFYHGLELRENEVLVVIYRTHDGIVYYTPLQTFVEIGL